MAAPRFVSCQGLGGFADYGFVKNGFELTHRTGTLDFGNVVVESNRHLVGDNWESNFSDNPLGWHIPENVDVVMGLPPCSGWSCWSGPANRGPDAKAHEHTRAFMLYTGRVKPKAAVFECVGQAYTQGREVMLKYRDMVEEVSGLEYDVHHVKMNNLMVGGFSYRPRYFWVAVRKGMQFGVEAEWPDSVPSIMDVIGDLADLTDTWEKQPYKYEHTPWVNKLISQTGLVDGHKGLDNIHNQRVKEMFEYLDKDGLDWNWGEGLSAALKRIYDARGELPPMWENKAPKIIERNFDMGFSLPYRWPANAWANVLTGGALDLVVHPTRPRCITHREAARIQGLPDDWVIKPSRGYSPLQSVWGKAVSANAGEWIGKHVKQSLEGTAPESGQLIGDREWLHETDRGFSRQKARARYFPGTKGGITRAYNPDLWPYGKKDVSIEAELDLEAAQLEEVCETV